MFSWYLHRTPARHRSLWHKKTPQQALVWFFPHFQARKTTNLPVYRSRHRTGESSRRQRAPTVSSVFLTKTKTMFKTGGQRQPLTWLRMSDRCRETLHCRGTLAETAGTIHEDTLNPSKTRPLSLAWLVCLLKLYCNASNFSTGIRENIINRHETIETVRYGNIDHGIPSHRIKGIFYRSWKSSISPWRHREQEETTGFPMHCSQLCIGLSISQYRTGISRAFRNYAEGSNRRTTRQQEHRQQHNSCSHT